MDAINAEAELAQDPQNANKQTTVKSLKTMAKDLKEEAADKKKFAEAALRAASTAQQQADEIKRKLLGGS